MERDKDTMERNKDRFNIPETLHIHATDCAQLADNMTSHGRPLDVHERALVKSAFSSVIDGVLEEVKYMILQDANPTDAIDDIMAISKLIKSI